MKKQHLYRIRKRTDFLAARTGEKRRGPLFLLEVKSREQTAKKKSSLLVARVGFTVTRKNGNAVKRNRIKRRLREAVRVGVNHMEAGTDYVIVAYRDVLHAPFKSLISELNRRIKPKVKHQQQRQGSTNGI